MASAKTLEVKHTKATPNHSKFEWKDGGIIGRIYGPKDAVTALVTVEFVMPKPKAPAAKGKADSNDVAEQIRATLGDEAAEQYLAKLSS